MRSLGSCLRRGRLRRVAQAQPEQRAALFRVRPRVPDESSQRNPVRRRRRVKGGEPRADEGGDRAAVSRVSGDDFAVIGVANKYVESVRRLKTALERPALGGTASERAAVGLAAERAKKPLERELGPLVLQEKGSGTAAEAQRRRRRRLRSCCARGSWWTTRTPPCTPPPWRSSTRGRDSWKTSLSARRRPRRKPPRRRRGWPRRRRRGRRQNWPTRSRRLTRSGGRTRRSRRPRRSRNHRRERRRGTYRATCGRIRRGPRGAPAARESERLVLLYFYFTDRGKELRRTSPSTPSASRRRARAALVHRPQVLGDVGSQRVEEQVDGGVRESPARTRVSLPRGAPRQVVDVARLSSTS